MNVRDAIQGFTALTPEQADVPLHEASLGGGFWKGLVLAGLTALRSLVKLDGNQSNAWDTVVQIIEAL